MENKIHLVINELDATTLDTHVNYVRLPLQDGSYGIQAGHAPMIGVVVEGIVKYRINDEDDYATVSDGIVCVMDNTVTIIVRSAELTGEIDYDRAKAAEIRAREKLKTKQEGINQTRYEAALRRSIQRQILYRLKH